jgi:branched-subunit amino acid aminotransferase/4-amino-4-deoxychorismate lyase
MPEPVAYINRRWIPLRDAAVPLWDAGFVLGATVSEQLRTFGGRLFRLDAHLDRLARSLAVVGLASAMKPGEIAAIADEIIARNWPLIPPGGDLGLAILITPGSYGSFAPAASGPTVILHTYPLAFANWADRYETGERLVTTSVQQTAADCWPRELKCRSRMHYYLADREAAAVEPGARALLTDSSGNVLETATANILACFGDGALVSPLAADILPGITRQVARELAADLGMAWRERPIRLDELASAQEVLLTSTPTCVLPVVSLNGAAIGAGRPGAIYRRLLAAFSELVGLDIASQASTFRDEAPLP